MVSVFDLNEQQCDKWSTRDNRYDMFKSGTRVRIICMGQDHNFFSGEETGIVIRNDGDYLGIIVKLDSPIHYKDSYVLTEFNFNPRDLVVIPEPLVPETNFVIYKYGFGLNQNMIYLPAGARVLSVQSQRNEPVIWALVDAGKQMIGRKIFVTATGVSFTAGMIKDMDYIGTFQLDGGNLVFHLWIEKE